MSIVGSVLLVIFYIISIAIGTIIMRYLANYYELNTSYKIAFYVIFIWVSIIYFINLTIQSLTRKLSFTEGQNFLSISIHSVILAISLSSYLILGPLVIKRFYETEFRESFSISIRFFIYIGVIQFLFFPIYFL